MSSESVSMNSSKSPPCSTSVNDLELYVLSAKRAGHCGFCRGRPGSILSSSSARCVSSHICKPPNQAGGKAGSKVGPEGREVVRIAQQVGGARCKDGGVTG